MKRLLWVIFGVLTVTIQPVLAQHFNCEAWMMGMVTQVDSTCSNITRNTLCYGNVTLTVSPRDPDLPVFFSQPGDTMRISDIAELTLSGLDPLVPEWGMGLMRVQANLPDTLPGQNVAMILFGDVHVRDESASDTPMQAFYLQTGLGAPRCRMAPESGLLIQTPDGFGRMDFVINKVQVSLGTAQQGATALIQSAPSELMTVTMLAGDGLMTFEDHVVELREGAQASIPVNSAGEPEGVPSGEVIPDAVTYQVPLNLLPDAVELPDLSAVVAPVVTTLNNVVAPVVTRIDNATQAVTQTVAETVETVTTVVEPVVEVVNTVTEPVLEVAAPIVEPVIEIIEPVTEILEPVAPVIEPVVEIVEPITQLLPPILPPILGGLLP